MRSLAGGDGGQPFRPGGCGVDDVGGEAAAGQPGTDAHQEPTGQQGADVVHVQQQQTAQQEQAEAGDRGGPAAQMIGQSSQHQQCGDGADGVGDDGHRDAGVGEPVLGPVDVEQGDRSRPTAANEATRETTADKNASRSVPPRRAWLIVGGTAVVQLVAPSFGARLVHGAFGRRDDLEALVRNRLAALDRQAVGAGGQTLLGTHQRVEPFPEVVGEALVEASRYSSAARLAGSWKPAFSPSSSWRR